MVCLKQMVHLSCIKISTTPNGPSFHLSLVTSVYHRVCPKWFLSRWYVCGKQCTYLVPTLTLSHMKRSEIPHDPHHLGVPSGASKMFSEPMVRSTQTVHLSCIKISTISEWKELSLEPRHWWVPSSACKMISEPMVHLEQIVHLSWIDTNIVSKWKEERFHMTHIT
jgi:hypothetical protein